jgi:hypothetical protein
MNDVEMKRGRRLCRAGLGSGESATGGQRSNGNELLS